MQLMWFIFGTCRDIKFLVWMPTCNCHGNCINIFLITHCHLHFLHQIVFSTLRVKPNLFPRKNQSMVFLISGILRVCGIVLFMESNFHEHSCYVIENWGRIKVVLALRKVWLQVAINNPSKRDENVP